MADKEQRADDGRVEERRPKDDFVAMGREGDVDGLQRYFYRYRMLAQTRPADEGWPELRDWTESQLAFALSQREDLGSKERAAELYADLSARHPEKDIHRENLRVMRAQVAAGLRARGEEAGDGIGDLQRALDLYGALFGEYPERTDYGDAASAVEHKLAFRLWKRGSKGDREALARSRDLYADLAEKDPGNEAVAKNLHALERMLAE